MVNRIGFVSPWLDKGGNQVPSFSIKKFDIEKFKQLDKKVQSFRLLVTCNSNLDTMSSYVKMLAELPLERRMVCFENDPLPFWERSDFNWFYLNYNNLMEIEKKARSVGYIARKYKVRISFQPTYCINGNKYRPLAKAMKDVEQHCRILEAMGYDTSKWHHCGTSINLFVGKKKYGTEELVRNIRTLSLAARNLITLTNDDDFPLAELRILSDNVPIRLDIDKHKRLDLNSKTFKWIYDSWNSTKPEIYLSGNLSKDKVSYMETLREHTDITLRSNIMQDRYLRYIDKINKR